MPGVFFTGVFFVGVFFLAGVAFLATFALALGAAFFVTFFVAVLAIVEALGMGAMGEGYVGAPGGQPSVVWVWCVGWWCECGIIDRIACARVLYFA